MGVPLPGGPSNFVRIIVSQTSSYIVSFNFLRYKPFKRVRFWAGRLGEGPLTWGLRKSNRRVVSGKSVCLVVGRLRFDSLAESDQKALKVGILTGSNRRWQLDSKTEKVLSLSPGRGILINK